MNPIHNQDLLYQYTPKVSVTHISWSLICDGDAAQDEGVAVVFGGSARFTDTFKQLPYSSVLPLTDKPLACPHVDRLGLQLEVLRQKESKETSALLTFNPKPVKSKLTLLGH